MVLKRARIYRAETINDLINDSNGTNSCQNKMWITFNLYFLY
jgi:hypothetical protein